MMLSFGAPKLGGWWWGDTDDDDQYDGINEDAGIDDDENDKNDEDYMLTVVSWSGGITGHFPSTLEHSYWISS